MPTPPAPGVPYALSKDDGPAFWNVDILWVLLASGAQTGGAFSCLWELCPEDSGPPPHWHEQGEHFYVVRGRIRYAMGERVVVAGPGTYVYIPRGTVHRFRVDSDTAELLNLYTLYTPAGFERTLTELAEPAPARTLPPRGRPPAVDPRHTARVLAEVGMHRADGPDPLGRTQAVGPTR